MTDITPTGLYLLEKYKRATLTIDETALEIGTKSQSIRNTLNKLGVAGLPFKLRKIGGVWRISSIDLGRVIDCSDETSTPPAPLLSNEKRKPGRPRKAMNAFLVDLFWVFEKERSAEASRVLQEIIDKLPTNPVVRKRLEP